jgi:hypothetical protein
MSDVGATTMIVLENIDPRRENRRDNAAPSPTKVSINLKASTVMAQADLIDRVFDLAFDVLYVTHIELRIREDAMKQ